MNPLLETHRSIDAASPAASSERLGRRRFLQGVGAAAGAGAIATVLPAGLAQAALPVGASRFAPLPAAVRIADTRKPSSYAYGRISDRQIRVAVRGRSGVPNNATAVVLTVTAVNWGEPNFVTVFPTGSSVPVVSNLNLPRPGEVTANLATVKVGNQNSVDLYQRKPCDVIVDLLGYYVPVTGAVSEGRFVGLETAARAIDTRQSFGLARNGSFTEVDLTKHVPADASSVVINLTATECTGPSYFTALPITAGAKKPTTSSLNVAYPGDTRASAVIVPVSNIGGRRRIKIYTLVAAKLIVDVTGYYTSTLSPSSTVGLFVPLAPQRILDTRLAGQIGKLWPGWVVECKVPGAAATGASAIVANVTGVESRGPGYLTVSAARRPRPNTSNVNWTTAGAVVPNHVITPISSTYGLQVYSSHGAHVLVDLAGYFTGTPLTPLLPAYVNPPPPPAPPNWVIRIPRIGLTSTVMAGDPRVVTDSGYSWHWTGTGYMGQTAHVAIFGHRTEHGGPYRYLHYMQNGDTFTVTTLDNREYTYRVVRRDLTDAQPVNILQATRNHPGTTFSIIACTVGYDSSKSAYPDVWAPTSLKYRIIVTGELVSWRQF